MRVLVCGGRDFRDRDAVYRELDALYRQISALASGGAPGADTMAWDWGWKVGIHCERYMADWKAHGRAAGPIRNQKMLDEFKPDLVLAFPGGRGTADMVSRAHAAGVPVKQAALPSRASMETK